MDYIIRNISFPFELVHLKVYFKLLDKGKTVPNFYMDYIIRNIRFWFEFVNLNVDTSSFLDSIDFSFINQSI